MQVIVGKGARETRVYVHPQTLAVLKRVNEDDRLMQVICRLHGELPTPDKSEMFNLGWSWSFQLNLSRWECWSG